MMQAHAPVSHCDAIPETTWHGLQVVTRSVLADISGEGVRAMAYAAYSKVQRPPPNNLSAPSARVPAAGVADDVSECGGGLPKVRRAAHLTCCHPLWCHTFRLIPRP